ncbi:restriction endonuclease subunit S [Heyndrickxia coagulans]|uniref:restriction endonuclease subunit S n=1 Tax=Heyndrickxia coagulans TaxID=1398 RepID=UPI00399CB938
MEELLEEALVPEEEQPYEVPGNWIWVYSKFLLDFIGGGTPPKGYNKYWDGDIPWATVKDIKGRYLVTTRDKITVAGLENSSTTMAYENELLLITRMSPGKSTITKISTAINQDLKIVRPKIQIQPYFLWLFFTVNRTLIESMSTGTTVKGIQVEKLKKIPFPVPPLKEQIRIAAKVERLLSKIDEAKRLIEEAKETFELRRAAILDKAFRGELTRKWREANLSTTITNNELNEEHYIIPKEWKWTTIGEITTFVGSGSTPKGGSDIYQTEGIPFIRSQNVLRNKMDIENIVYISEEIYSKMKRTQMCGEETLLNITGASIGRAAKLSINLIPCNINQHVCALRFVDNINKDLPQYWLNSPYIQKIIREWQIGATRQALNFPQVRSLPFPLMPKEEQDELVKIISGLLGKEDKMRILTELDKSISQLKDSILSKAFRGELGTNDPDEESAIELLKEVLQEQVK